MKRKARKFLSLLLIMCMVFQLMPAIAKAAGDVTTLTFGDADITETVSGDGYSVSGTTLKITAPGTYKITGTCASGNIEVAKSLSDVTLILDNLDLTSTTGAPIVVKKASNVTIHIENTVTLTDNENPEDEESTDTEVADAYEGAAIKVKSGSSAVFCGSGTLKVNGNAKNGIKGAATASLIFNDSRTTYQITAANNGIGSDGSVSIYGGTFHIKAANDGIKSVPEETDADSIGAVEIYGGTFDLEVDGDGIQADKLLKITDGDFTIKTFGGYETNGTKYYNVTHNLDKDTAGTFDGDNMSCKALKASGDRTDVENELLITGGTYHINCADDAVHSDAYATVTGGSFYIYTGDDGMHADTSLTLGVENGPERDPEVYVYACFEGLEAGTIYTYGGKYWITAADDGMNAGGGSDSENTGDSFVPGGQPGRPGFGNTDSGTTDTSAYTLYVYGGNIYIDCLGDGLDSNGSLYLYGGTVDVFSKAYGGDDSPFDCDGSWVIDGATVFGAGSNSMNERPANGSQQYTASNTTANAGTVVSVSSNGTAIHTATLPRKVGYMIYSSPEVTGSVTFSTGGTVSNCLSTAWTHDWKDGVEDSETGVITYACGDCSATETKTITETVNSQCDDTHAYEKDEEATIDEGFAITFDIDAGVEGIDVYYTQDYTAPNESNVTSAVSRDSDSGAPDSTGGGQVNFRVRLLEGYSLSSIEVTEGTYKNIKDSSDTGQANTYRITKIAANTTITVKTVNCGHANVSGESWTWEEDCSAAKLNLHCDDCNADLEFSAIVTSILENDNNILFTAVYTHNGTIYTDTKSAKAFEVTFAVDEGVESVLLYYKKDYSNADESDVTTAVARDGDSGNPVINGDGQVNFQVKVKDGYTLETVTADANYKNVKDVSDETYTNVYRVTKITGSVVITVDTSEATEENPEIPEEPKELTITRIYGSGRCATAVEAAKELKLTLDASNYNSIIIASGSNFADALAGSYLAVKKEAPILLHKGTSSVSLNQEYIQANLSADGIVYLLGGEAAVPESVEDGLKSMGVNVKRLAGKTRYETNLAILKEAGVTAGEEILVATGKNFADSLSASATGKPILLVNGSGKELSDNQKEYLTQYGGGKLVVLGGTAAVSDLIEEELKAYGTVSRIYGSGRYETSVKIAEAYFGETDTIVVASGKNFPDGLTGGPVAYAKSAPLLLTNKGSEIADYVAKLPLIKAYIMGGTAAVSDAAIENIFVK